MRIPHKGLIHTFGDVNNVTYIEELCSSIYVCLIVMRKIEKKDIIKEIKAIIIALILIGLLFVIFNTEF